MNFLKKLKNHFVPSENNVYRPHVLRKPWLIFFVTVVLASEGVFLVDLVARQSALDFIAAVLPGEVVAFTNDERSLGALNPVSENSLLTAAAQAKAADMAAKGYFSHTGPDGKEPWVWVKDAGYEYQYAGENLAVRFNGSRDVVNAWMASPTHRANIVKPVYTEIGVGVAQGEFRGEPATYVVQYFGAPRSSVSAALPAAASVPSPAASANSQVAGAETQESGSVLASANEEPAIIPVTQHTEAPWSSVAKNLLQSETQSGGAVIAILAAVAMIMIVGLALTFFVHIQIQPTDMLIGGAVVAVIALSFLTLNMQTPFVPTSTQTAAVMGALPSQGGFIDSTSASIEAL
ncbi:MAG: stress protein [Parcubacteria group bacterium Gr01-1014_56]|nr:MAG: stress protein [Parcubacteria group bacterium Gr01-1014_56]